MHLLELPGIILVAYLAAGRTGAIISCLLFGMAPWIAMLIALAMDLAQVPAYGLVLEMSQRYVSFPNRFHKWIERRSNKLQEWIQKRGHMDRIKRFKPAAVIFVSTIPIRGFGVFSACILAYLFGYRRLSGTLLIMSGSLIGSIISILLFYFPVRWLNAL